MAAQEPKDQKNGSNGPHVPCDYQRNLLGHVGLMLNDEIYAEIANHFIKYPNLELGCKGSF